MQNRSLIESLDAHLDNIREGQFIYLDVKQPTAPYSKGKYDSDMLNQQTGKIEIAINPSSNELSQLLKDSERGYLRGEFTFKWINSHEVKLKDVYFWDATKMVHDEIQLYLTKRGEVSLSIIIDRNRQIVKENIWHVEDEDGCPNSEAAIAWGKLVDSLIRKYSLKLDPEDRKCLNNWLSGKSYDGSEIEEWE